jgi:DNA repair protein RadC
MASTTYHTGIKELPEEERPRERLMIYGARALSTPELIAIALRTGSHTHSALTLAQRLLSTCHGLEGLSQASVEELCQVPGIGPAKASQLLAAIELGRRAILTQGDPRPQIGCPQDAANLLASRMADALQEELHVLLLNTRHRVMRAVTVYQGSVNSAQIRTAEVFREAIRDNAKAIIVAHNHPSGDTSPSTDDVQVTAALVQAGRLLDIEVLDHLIIGRGEHTSLKERGLGFG